MAEDKIIATTSDGSNQEISLTYRGLTIGSGSRNDIILAGEGVSQQHLRITFDGSHYNVLLLPSTLPASLDDFQLLHSVQRQWTPGQTLRVGENQLQLVQSESVEAVYETGPRAGQPLTGEASPLAEQVDEPPRFQILLIGLGFVVVIIILYAIFGT